MKAWDLTVENVNSAVLLSDLEMALGEGKKDMMKEKKIIHRYAKV